MRTTAPVEPRGPTRTTLPSRSPRVTSWSHGAALRRWCAGSAVAGIGLITPDARTQPWLQAPAPVGVATARSVLVTGANEPLFVAPTVDAPRRGAASLGARLPLYASRSGAGCEGAWLMVGALAWLCSGRVEPSIWPAPSLAMRSPPSDGLPYRYHFVGELGSLGYRDLATAELGTPDAELEPGFAVAIVRTQQRGPGWDLGLTTKGLWVPMRDLRPANPLPTLAIEVDGALNVGWVYVESAPVHASPGGRRKREERPRFSTFDCLETVTHHRRRWYRIGDDAWLREDDVRVPSRPDPGPTVGPHERWIDVDRGQQILTAYEGARPVFVTLVSTGRGAEGTEQSTPSGDHRLWVKLISSDMDNLENTAAERLYAIQDVPWVMYFDRGYGLHGTFWHRGFGRVRSHGCVNLAPLDALWLFNWTSPHLPGDWSAVLPTAYDRGTLVHVR